MSQMKDDASVASDVERMVARAVETFGRLDYAVDNAGIEGPWASISDLPEDEWDRVLGVNLKGIFLCCSDEASYITGTTLTPDGGFTLTV